MAIISLEDETGRVDVTLFSTLYERVAPSLVVDQPFVVMGQVSPDELTGGIRVVADSVQRLDVLREAWVRTLVVNITRWPTGPEVQAWAEILKAHVGGKCQTKIRYQTETYSVELPCGSAFRVYPAHTLTEALMQLEGIKSVVFEA